MENKLLRKIIYIFQTNLTLYINYIDISKYCDFEVHTENKLHS